jgi:hypothetical protein
MSSEQIGQNIQKLANLNKTQQAWEAEVLEVNESEGHVKVQPLSGQATRRKVRLRSVMVGDDLGLKLIPKQGTTVLVAQLYDDTANLYVAASYEVQKVVAEIAEGVRLVIEQGEISVEFDKLSLGNQALEPAVLGDKLETLLKNFFQQTYDTHVHPTALGPSGPPQPLSAAQVSQLPNIKSQKTELE